MCKDWTGTERALIAVASELYGEIGHDLCMYDESPLENTEVASVLQDRMLEHLEEFHGTDLASAWQSLTDSKKYAICMEAL